MARHQWSARESPALSYMQPLRRDISGVHEIVQLCPTGSHWGETTEEFTRQSSSVLHALHWGETTVECTKQSSSVLQAATEARQQSSSRDSPALSYMHWGETSVECTRQSSSVLQAASEARHQWSARDSPALSYMHSTEARHQWSASSLISTKSLKYKTESIIDGGRWFLCIFI